MQDLVTKYLENFKMERRMKRRLGGILLVLALVVTMGVYWQLKLTGAALTNETYCGKEEHQHSDDCYEWVLVCGYDDAEETATDTSEAQTEAETSGHTHTAECYETVTTLVCGLEDTEGVSETTDGESETGEEHTHDESCYATEEVLICGQEETAEDTSAADTDLTVSETAHVHTEACYEKVLVCGLEEHTHSIECMSNDTADVETAADWEATLPSDISDDWTEAVAAIAASQLGYTESTANFVLGDDGTTRRGYTRYGAWAGNEYGDWDAMFVSFCLHYAGISTEDFPESTGAYAWAVMLNGQDLYANASDYTPVMGDLVFFDTDEDGKADRVGIVTSVDEEAGQLTVVEGDYAADTDTADAVCANQYALSDSRIVGFGLVSAAHEESATAEELTWQTLTVTVDDVTVTVSGMLPEGSSVSAEQVPVELEGLDVHVALEISILLEDGTAYEPEEDALAVAIESPEITSSDSVYYVPEEGTPEKVTTNAITGYAEFDAEHFSTYVIAADGDDDDDTTSIISATYTDASGNVATLTISSSSDTDLLTGQYANISITLGLDGAVDWNGESVRVYLTASDTDVKIYGSTGGTDAWTVGDTRNYEITGSDTTVAVTLCQDTDSGAYYLEIDGNSSMSAGDTLNFNISLGYPNRTTTDGSDGGTVTVSGAIGESTTGTLDFTWTTHTDTYGVTKQKSGTAYFESSTEGGEIYLAGLAYTVTSKKLSTYSSYGKDPVAEFSWTDTLVLPDGLSWREGLVDAINNGDYTSDGKTITVTIGEGTYTLCAISHLYSSYVENADVSVDADGNIQVIWSFKSNGTTQYENNVINRAYTITYGDQVIVCDTDENGVYSAASYELTNTVIADYSFTYSTENQTATDDATVTVKLSEGTLSLKKETTTENFYMGSSYEFTVTAENTEALPYSGLSYIEDTLNDWLYIEPEDMEELLDTYSDSLTIKITGTALYSNPVIENVTDVNGEEKTITQQEQGTDTTYSGEKSGSGTLISTENGSYTSETITLYRAGDLIQMSVGTGNYTIGTGGDYSSLSAALDDLGYYVTNSTIYTLHWDLGEDYTLNGNSALEYTYTATVKDTFMRLTGDQFYDLNQSDSEYWTQDNVLVGGTVSNTVTACDETDNLLDSARVSGDVYRDFVLTKGCTISGNSLTTGSVVTYTVKVKHEGNASYDALPLVDQLADGQVLLVPVSENSSNSSLSGLGTMTVDGTEYYVLDQAGSYENVYINSGVLADKIVVRDGSTLIYCYLVVSGKGTTSIQYTTLVDAEGDVDGFSLKNQVWLNDHETHRLYAETSLNGSVLSIDKKIVTEKESTPSEDVTVSNSTLSDGGEIVTYRLELKNNSDTAITVTGDNVYDALPVNVSGDAWTESDISVAVDSSEATITAGDAGAWATGWSVSEDTADDTQCYIIWTGSHTITFTGSVYIYVTLTYPDGEAWTNYYDAYRSDTLVNIFHAYALESEVTHSISTATKATLFKGVYATGLASGQTSGSTFYKSDADNSLTYYTNHSAGEYGYVEYYVVLYNEGPVNLYLQDMTDTLPTGFTYISGSAAPAADITVYNTAGEEMELAAGYTVTGTASSGTVTFTLTGGNLGYSDTEGMYYLEPGQAIVFTYKMLTGYYYNTDDTETNIIKMPFYDYNGGGLSVSDDVSGETVTGDWYDAETNPKNDGDAEVETGEDAEGNTTYSLTSSVNVYRDQIRPGITKTATVEEAGETDTITWNVTVSNDGESTMTGYYIYDVVEDPYNFTGTLTYTVYDLDRNSNTYTIGTLVYSESSGLGIQKYYSSTSSYNSGTTYLTSGTWKAVYGTCGSGTANKALLYLRTIEVDGNLVLIILFPTTTVPSSSTASSRTNSMRAYSIPSGGYGVLSVKTVNTSDTYVNGTVTNTAYIRPIQSFAQYHIGEGIEISTGSEETVVGNSHAVKTEATVPVNYGYYTTSSKSVTELDEDGNVLGSASSSGSLDSLQLTSSNSTIRYTLSVTNGDEAMTQLVLVDTLPEQGDTDPLTSAQRYSDFKVSLADNPNFVVAVTTEDGTVAELAAKNYTVMYSDATSFTADNLTSSDESMWYSAAKDSTRSFRVTLVFDDDFASIPANATVTVSFNAEIDGTATGVAWNSFSYMYSSTSAAHEATATPIPVGIKAPVIPVLAKQVLDADGNEVSLTEAKTYSFLIYQGDTLTDVDTSDTQALYKALSEGNYTFTEVSLTVAAGEGTDSKTLENLVQYIASVDSEGVYTATAGTTEWTWTNNTSYTIVELTQDADYPFHTWSRSDESNTYTSNSCTFTYSNSTVLTLTCSNQEVTYDLPKTGGTGTGLFTLLGLMLCGGAAMLLFFRRRWV